MLIPQLLPQVLAFYRDPRSQPELRNGNLPLPAGVTELLESISGALGPEHIDGVAEQLNSSTDELHDALRFFVKEAFFRAGDEPMRTLGLQAPLTPERLKKHYRLLITLFHPDRDTSGEGWDTLYASRINDAHGTLRKQLRDGATYSDDWPSDDTSASWPINTRPSTDSEAPDVIETKEETALHAAVNVASRSFDLVRDRPSRVLIIWRLLKRRPRLSVYGALAGLVLAVGIFVAAVSEPTRPVVMATPQPLAQSRANLQAGSAGDTEDDWRRAVLTEPPAAGSQSELKSRPMASGDIVASSSAEEIERRIEARIRARMETATRSILGRATRPKPVVAQPSKSTPKPGRTTVVADSATATVTVAATPTPEPTLAPTPTAPIQTTAAAAQPTTTVLGKQVVPPNLAANAAVSKPTAVILAEEPADTLVADTPELQIQALITQLEAAYEAENVDAFAALFTASADATEVVGREDIYDHYADYFADTWIDRFQLIDMQWVPQGDGSYAIDSQVEIWMRLRDGSYEEQFVIPIAWLAVPAERGYLLDKMEY